MSLHACDCARFPERFSTSTSLCSLKLKSLHRFTSTAIAVEEITAIQEGKLGKGLKQFLSDEVVGKGKGKEQLMVADPKLGESLLCNLTNALFLNGSRRPLHKQEARHQCLVGQHRGPIS